MERGQRKVSIGVASLIFVVAVVWLLPDGLRVAWFLAGLGAGAAISLTGGLACLRSVSQDGPTFGRMLGAVVGLSVGATVGVLTFWGALGALS
jgi:hypothetical protein